MDENLPFGPRHPIKTTLFIEDKNLTFEVWTSCDITEADLMRAYQSWISSNKKNARLRNYRVRVLSNLGLLR